MPKFVEDEFGEVFTELEVSKILKRSKVTLAQDRFQGRGLPYIKLGGQVRYLKADIEEYIKNHRVNPES